MTAEMQDCGQLRPNQSLTRKDFQLANLSR